MKHRLSEGAEQRRILATDQRGFSRTIDDPAFPNATGGDGTDIGAVEMNLVMGADTDSDELPDDYERFYNLSDPDADADGDSMNNGQEFRAGTSPINSTSLLRINSLAFSGSDVVLTFDAIIGRAYRLERKEMLGESSWMSLSDLIPPQTGSAQFTNFGAAPLPQRFYHLRVLP